MSRKNYTALNIKQISKSQSWTEFDIALNTPPSHNHRNVMTPCF